MSSISPALRYPRSFLGLLVAGFALFAFPLVVALLWSAWSTERLAERGTSAVVNAAQAARASRSLVNRTGSIERLAKQIAVQADAELLADLARAHSNFTNVASELSRLPLDSALTAALKRTIERERALYEMLAAAPGGTLSARTVAAQAGELSGGAYEMLAISHIVADREVERLRESAEEVQKRLVMLVLLAGAAALAIALVLTRVIARPIAQLDHAIRRLGRADFGRPIRVAGPADLRLLGERLDWLRRRLTQLETQKSRFLQHLSHDLKTPLTALREGADLLSDQITGPLAPAQRKVVSILRDNSIKLQHMIEELLDYQRTLQSAATLDAEPVALEPLLRGCVGDHQIAAAAKGQRLAVDAAPATIWADAAKLRAVVDNLLGNAVKFTPGGGSIQVRARADAERAQIDVIDSGPGIPVEEREAIFEAFYRGRAGAHGRSEGTGLGLAIARDFVKAHGGRIEVVPGVSGGHFRVTLPARSTPVPDEAP
jgi:two-component system sensor histidine kinase GlrK